jgi:TonB family protein
MRRLPACLIFLLGLAALAAPQDSPAPPEQVPNDAMRALPVKRVSPIYPPLARQARIEGKVILRVTVTRAGDVQNLQLISGHSMLAPAAIDAIKQWKYQPYQVNGELVDVQTTVQVNFKLATKPTPSGIAGDVPGGLLPGTIGSIASEAAPIPADSANRVRVSEGVMRAFRIEESDAVYPPLALQARIEGTVILRLQISKAGDVEKLDLISGHPMLAPSAIEAVKQWKYKPYLVNGDPKPVETVVSINFAISLETGQGSAGDSPLPQNLTEPGAHRTRGSSPPRPRFSCCFASTACYEGGTGVSSGGQEATHPGRCNPESKHRQGRQRLPPRTSQRPSLPRGRGDRCRPTVEIQTFPVESDGGRDGNRGPPQFLSTLSS